MKKRTLVAGFAFLMPFISGSAQNVTVGETPVIEEINVVHPNYAKDAIEADRWGCGKYTFLDISAGGLYGLNTSALTGMGRADIGRWWSPAFATRVGLMAFDLADIGRVYAHADVMLNSAGLLHPERSGKGRLQLTPFVGMGAYCKLNGLPDCRLAADYGVGARWRITRHAFFNAQAGAYTFFPSKETYIETSAGVSLVLGKIDRNLQPNGMVYVPDDWIASKEPGAEKDSVSMNDYSGLNSLRARLANPGWNGIGEVPDNVGDADKGVPDGIGTAVMNTAPVSSVPVYFFFQLNSDALLVPNQLVNLDDIAQIAIDENRTVSVAGAADAATGSETTNNRLAEKRASYIKNELVKRGVPEDRVEVSVEGGINAKQPKEANRYAVVRLQ